jgi:hypothetical protein
MYDIQFSLMSGTLILIKNKGTNKVIFLAVAYIGSTPISPPMQLNLIFIFTEKIVSSLLCSFLCLHNADQTSVRILFCAFFYYGIYVHSWCQIPENSLVRKLLQYMELLTSKKILIIFYVCYIFRYLIYSYCRLIIYL